MRLRCGRIETGFVPSRRLGGGRVVVVVSAAVDTRALEVLALARVLAASVEAE